MPKGYMGKILRVNLSTGDIREELVPDVIYASYLSGLGLGAHVLQREIPAGADPLGPENILGFVSGLLTGTPSLFTGRWMVVGKSPLTGGWGDANCGGTFSPAIKRCGYDGIFFTGISESPVYLEVSGGNARLKDASDLWGKDTVETETALLRRFAGKKKPRIACIGPAGERRSLISGIANDRGRMAARSGLGAVMGSKRLKAVVLSGTHPIHVFNPEGMKRLSRKCHRWVAFQPPFLSGPKTAYLGTLLRLLPFQMIQDGLLYKIMLRKWGTVSMNQAGIEMGDAPVKNWAGSHGDLKIRQSRSLNPDAVCASELYKYHCYACPLGCGAVCAMPKPYDAVFPETHRPEYETMTALGALCMHTDRDSLFYLNEKLNRAGMDTISAGAAVAFAIECYESALITRKDTGGLELTWGNSAAIMALIDRMIQRRGIGDLLADGTRKAAQRLGFPAEKFAIQVGGQELAMHDGRLDPGFNLHYAVEPTPGRHTIGSRLYYEMYRIWKRVHGIPRPSFSSFIYRKAKKFQDERLQAAMGAACSRYMALLNGSGACMFGAFMGADRFPIFEWLNAATGWERTPEAYMEIGGRIQTLRQSFNVKHGLRPGDFQLKGRPAGRRPGVPGSLKDHLMDLEPVMQAYWEIMGWDRKTGVPKSADWNGSKKV